MERSWIEEARKRIDSIDREIARLLDERMELCRLIGRYKKRLGIPLRDPLREKQVLDSVGMYREVFKAIITLCISVQQEQ